MNLQREEGKDSTNNVGFFKMPMIVFPSQGNSLSIPQSMPNMKFQNRGLNYERKLKEHHKYFSTGGKYINKISDNSNTFKQLNFPQKNMFLSS